MSEKARIAAIFSVVGVLLGGGLFYFFKIHQPKQARAAAQAEVLAWEQRLDAARTCLLGPSPASPDTGEALAIRELTPDPWDRGTCTKLIGRLARGVAEDTGLMTVEHAWMTVDRAAAKVATAFVSHVDPSGEPIEKRGQKSPLPAALAELDAAHADLRKAAGMGPPAYASVPALPRAEVLPLALDGAAVTELEARLPPSAGGMVAFGAAKGKGEVQVVLTPGAAPRIVRTGPGSVLALPDLTWGAAGLLSEVVIGTTDAAGTFSAKTSLPTPDRAVVELAVGTLASGLVAYGSSAGLTLARASGETFVADKPFPVVGVAVTADPTGRALLAWTAPDGTAIGMFFDGRTAQPPARVSFKADRGAPRTACLTNDRGWVAGDDGLSSWAQSFDQTGQPASTFQAHALLGCGADAALLQRQGSQEFEVCSATCRTVELPRMRSSRVATIAHDKVVAVVARPGVLGVWREGGAPAFYATATNLRPLRALSDGKVIDVLADTDDGVVVVRVPAA